MIKTREATRLTREMLRSIAPGETLRLMLPDARACYAGKASAYQFQNIEGCKFNVRMFAAIGVLEITRTEVNDQTTKQLNNKL